MSLANEHETDKEKEKEMLLADSDEEYEAPCKGELHIHVYPLLARAKSTEHTLKKGGSGDNATACEDDGYETGGKQGDVASPHPEHHSTRSREDSRVDQLIAEMECLTTKDQLKDSAIELLRLVPDGYIPLPHQVGGRRHIDGRLGFLRQKNQPHLLYKPYTKGIREVVFYESVYKHTSHLKDDTLFPSLWDPSCTPPIPLSFLPMYYGTTAIDDKAGHQTNYLILEDITHRFNHPCIIDIKMGTRVHADQANIAGERRKFLIQELFGFRIAGMRVYNHVKGEYVYYDRHYRLSITDANAPSIIGKFFEVHDGTHRVDMIKQFISKLIELIQWMEKQNYLCLFATSILVAYEGGPSPKEGERPGLLDMRMVDFAYAYDKQNLVCPDANVIFGVKNFNRYLNIYCTKLLSKSS